jgi:5-methylcytosine-specific restriction endonuclease McrA
MTKERKLEYDKKWQKAVCYADKYRCQVRAKGCTSGAYNGAHHIIPRWVTRWRWNLTNGISCCPNCHDWIHAHPAEFQEFLDENDPILARTIRSMKTDCDTPSREELDKTLQRIDNYLIRHGICDEAET